MIIANNTTGKTMLYNIARPGQADCGTLGPGDEAVLASYNDKTHVTVTLTIPLTGDQMELTLNDSGL